VQARINAVSALLPDVQKAIATLYQSAHSAGVPAEVLGLVHLRVSQINGCSACVDSGARGLRRAGMSDERLFTAAAKHFSEPELAALVLWIATSNFFNRLNVTTRQPAGQDWG
jgi:AhpD family alkylhydroperoxidase